MKSGPNPWTDAAVSRLKELWPIKKRAEIGAIMTEEFGHYFDRNSVGAKARRLNLPLKAGGNPNEAPALKAEKLSYHVAPRPSKRPAADKNIQPPKLLPSVYVEPSKEQSAADKQLI